MTVLSPWTVYLILQLDQLRNLFIVLATGGLVLSLISIISADLRVCDFTVGQEKKKEIWKLHRKYCLGFAICGIFSFVVYTMLPSTKTMAAVVVLPAIVNSPTVHKETGELYQLAKQGLTKVVDNFGKEAPKAEEPNTESEEK